jgi:hypothetical protein
MAESEPAEPFAGILRRKRAYVLPELQILYVSLAKNACTSLKWLMAELAGEDPAGFAPRLGSATTAEEGIHSRGRWRKVPRLSDLDEGTLRSIRPDNGWFVFAVVRDPRVRLFSAWENKFLLRNPGYAHYRDEPWYPRVPRTPEDVVADFAGFVEMLGSDPDHELHRDTHFSTQTRLLVEESVPYSRIYEISELDELIADLGSHLETQGSPRPLRLGRSNDTPLAANAAVFAGGVRETIERIYASDFERFGDRWDYTKIESRPAWTADAFKHAQAVVDLDERIIELREMAERATARNRELARQVRTLESRVKELETRGTSRPSLGSRLRRRG